MRASQADEHVVQVRLVRVERRLAFQDACRHHAEYIEDRDGQDRQHVGIGGGRPLQVLHRLVRKVGIVGIVLLADTGQEVMKLY